MATTELRNLKPEELQQKIDELRKELVEKQRALHAGELQKSHEIKNIRRTIATALTIKGQQSTAAKKEEE